MKKYLFLLLFLTIGLTTLARLGYGAKAFEGEWSASGVAGLEGPGFYLNYTFGGGEYAMEGYPPISESGTYEVVFSESDDFSEDYVFVMTPLAGDPEPGGPYLMGMNVYSDGTMSLGSMSSIDRGYHFYKK